MLKDPGSKLPISLTIFERLLLKEKQFLSKNFQNSSKKQEGLLKKKEEKVGKHLTGILSFYEEYKQSLSESDIHLLRSSQKRIEIIKKATIDVEKLDIDNSFGDLNRESELNILWKLIQPSKTQKENIVHSGSGAGYGGLKHAKSLNTQPIQALKNKALKDTTNKHAGSFLGVRASTNFKKEANMIPAVTQSHSFAFSIIDKGPNKPSQTPQNREPKAIKEDIGNENRKPLERRHSSPPVKPAAALKNKHHHGYLARRNEYKEREILKEKGQTSIPLSLSASS